MSLLVATFPNGGQAGIPYRDEAELCEALRRALLLTPTNLRDPAAVWTCEPESERMPS